MSDERPLLISVVIPHFNRAELLVETLASLRGQTFPDWEAIVVDDGSDPKQWESIQRLGDERIRVVPRDKEPKGPSKCRNIGVDLSRGTHVVFLDSDDLMAPWCLAQRVESIAKHPDLGYWVFPVMLFQEQMGDSDLCWNDMTSGCDLDRFLKADPPWHTSSPIWQRTTLDEFGGFNEAVMYGDDTDLHIRALLGNIVYEKVDAAVPDIFIRRDDKPRITNTLSDQLVQSRRTRLLEGSKALDAASPESRAAWEGQYFVEAEFLLFNTTPPGPPIAAVFDDWKTFCRPSWMRRLIVRSYLDVAVATRDRAYLILRIARRVAMGVLPGEYFPTGGSFQNTTLSNEVAQQLRSRLSDAVSAP